MERNDCVYIFHAIDAAEKAAEISNRINRDDPDSDEIYRYRQTQDRIPASLNNRGIDKVSGSDSVQCFRPLFFDRGRDHDHYLYVSMPI